MEMGNSISVILMIFLIFFLLCLKVGLAFIPAIIAKKKGYGFAGFFILGLIEILIGTIIALCLYNRTKQMEQIKEIIENALADQKNNFLMQTKSTDAPKPQIKT